MQTQYRAYAPQQASQRSPHATNQRRGGIGPMIASGSHPSVPPTQAQLAQQQQAQAHATELAKRRSRKPTDKNMPEGVEECVIDPEMVQRYRELRDVEKKLDSTMMRKRLDIMDASQRDITGRNNIYKTLRVWISNTVEDQVWQGNGLSVDAFDFTPNTEASYKVKVEGHFIDDEITHEGSESQSGAMGEDHQDLGKEKHSPKARPRFSHFFRAMSVEFDKSHSRDGQETFVDWKKPEPANRQQSAVNLPGADFDEITFKRIGDENQNIKIHLYRHELPEKYQLSPELAEVIDLNEATQQEAVMMLWEYIRMMGLQEDEEKRNFRCDELLKKVVKRGDVGHIPLLNEYVTQHLEPLPPISLPYTIRVDGAFHRNPTATVYNIQVPIEDPVRAHLLPLINNSQYMTMLKEVTGLDDQLARLVQAISISKAKHGFFLSLSEDPANFFRNWLSSQKRDLDVILGEASRGEGEMATSDEWRKGGKDGIWGTHNARESVNVLLSKQR